MGGTIRGRIECFNNIISSSAGLNVFKNIFEHYNNHPLATLVALQFGGGTGTDYHDGGNPWGEGNAFFVFKMAASALRNWDYYVLFQLAGNAAFGAAPGNPGLCNGTTQSTSFMDIGCAVMIGIGGDQNPWNGTSVGDGTDTKGTPVWVIPGAGTELRIVGPRSNGPARTHATNRENTVELFDTSIMLRAASENNRYHIFGDDDHLIIMMDEDDNNNYSLFALDVYDPNPGATIDRPMLMVRDTILPLATASIGTTTGNSATLEGGISINASFRPNYHFDRNLVVSAAEQPSVFTGANVFDVLPLSIRGSSSKGHLGYTRFIQEAADVATHDEDSTRRLVALSTAALADAKIIVPWDGTTVPKSGVTKEGVAFTNP